MRFFYLKGIEDLAGFFFPTLIFIIVFAVTLGFVHFRGRDDERRKSEVHTHYPEGLADREAPFPLGMTLILAGALIWGFFYILVIGLLEIKI